MRLAKRAAYQINKKYVYFIISNKASEQWRLNANVETDCISVERRDLPSVRCRA